MIRRAPRSTRTDTLFPYTTRFLTPSFNIWPEVGHHTETLPDGSRDIVIPSLVPNELITISYLYFAPVTVAQVNAGVKCDQGFAHEISVLLQRQYPWWFNFLAAAFMISGVVAWVYIAYLGEIGRANV